MEPNGRPQSQRARRRAGRLPWTAMVALATVAVFAGWATASMVTAHLAQAAEGDYVVVNGAVPGVAPHALVFATVPTPPPITASRNHQILSALALRTTLGHLDRYCAATCTAGHFAQELEYTLSAQSSAEGFQMIISSGAGAARVSTTLYFHLPATALGATVSTLVVFVDLGAGGPTSSATVAIQQCSTATHCP